MTYVQLFIGKLIQGIVIIGISSSNTLDFLYPHGHTEGLANNIYSLCSRKHPLIIATHELLLLYILTIYLSSGI